MSEKKRDTELECPICLDKLTVSDLSYSTTTPCHHFYHTDCILLWTKISASTCPQCRTELSSVNVVNESKIIPIERKKADRLIGMIEQPSSSTDPSSNNPNTSSAASAAASSYGSSRPRIMTTEGLVNVFVSTPENATRRQNRSLYERMIEATSNPIFHLDDNDIDFDDYNEDELYERTSSNSRRSGSLFRRRERSIYTMNEPDTGHNKLSNQQCCICDTSVSISQIIVCPQCSALYHLSCCDGSNCPLCEEWIGDVQAPSIPCASKRSRIISRGADRSLRSRDPNRAKNDDTSYYVELVNELQRRSGNNTFSGTTQNTLPMSAAHSEPEKKTESSTEKEAWEALNLIQQSSTKEDASNDKEIQIPLPTDPVPDYPAERKLKRPKRSISKTLHTQPAKLTESALAHLDSKNDKRPSRKSHCSLSRQKSIVSSKQEGLSFTQKLIVQRLLLKPRLKKDLANKLTFDSYTELNKHLSHELYSYVQHNQLAISSMNAVIELAEREGFLPFVNRKGVDQFSNSCKNNPIITRFVNCEWRNNDESFTGQVQNIINLEVQKWINL